MWGAVHLGQIIWSGTDVSPTGFDGFKNTRINSGVIPNIGGNEGNRKVGMSISAKVKPAHTIGFLRFDWAMRIDQRMARPRDM